MGLASVLLVGAAPLASAAVNNALAACQAVAGQFFNTCTGGPAASVAAISPISHTCTGSSATAVAWCPSTAAKSGFSCTFSRRLCVSCFTSGGVTKIRVQTNGLPNHCVNTPATVAEADIDFEANFSPDVAVKFTAPTYSVTSSVELTALQCDLTKAQDANVPSASGYIKHGSTALTTLLGVAASGAAIMHPASADNVDPLYPSPATYSAEHMDTNLIHPQAAGILHYHLGVAAMVAGSSTTMPSPCQSVAACIGDVAGYSLSGFTSGYRRLTVAGVAKDGHAIYGPYGDDGALITTQDVCGGSYLPDLTYGYVMSQQWPYIGACFGPGNYPSTAIAATCSSNARAGPYSASTAICASAGNTSNGCSAATTITTATPTPGTTPGSGLSSGAVTGIAVGCSVGGVALSAGAGLGWRAHRQRVRARHAVATSAVDSKVPAV